MRAPTETASYVVPTGIPMDIVAVPLRVGVLILEYEHVSA
jgi:hypothetical protein